MSTGDESDKVNTSAKPLSGKRLRKKTKKYTSNEEKSDGSYSFEDEDEDENDSDSNKSSLSSYYIIDNFIVLILVNIFIC